MVDWYFECLLSNLDNGNPIAWLVYLVWEIGSTYYYRITIRGYCALFGCKEHRYRSDLLPDDCYEWYCDRCNAEGINWQVQTVPLFYSGEPIRNFIGIEIEPKYFEIAKRRIDNTTQNMFVGISAGK